MSQVAATNTVDITPTWGEWGRVYRSLAESGECHAIKELASDFAWGMAAAQALKTIRATLTEEQKAAVSRVIADELKKQGR